MTGMHMRLATGAVLAACFTAVSLQAKAQDVRWDMQSAFSGSFVPLGTSGKQFADRVNESSGGQFEISFHDPGDLVANSDVVDAVASGEIEAAWTTSGYHESEFGSAVSFFTAIPFGPEIGEFRAWKLHGGGNELREELYNARGITAIDTFCIGPESSGWFRTEVTSPEQLRGLRMRIFGLGARVLEKLGVSTVLLAGRDVYGALERGEIDAAEFSSPMIDLQFRFHEVARYNYYPGWHQRVSCGELIMNKTAYDALPGAYKGIIKAAAAEQRSSTYHLTEARNPEALMTMRDDFGVNIRRWPDETLKRFEAAWNEVVAEESAADARFKKIADSYFAFRKLYRVWGDAQSFKTTYQDDSAPSSPHSLPLVMAADNSMGQQGFVRIINRSDEAGEVEIHAIDDDGDRRGPIDLSLAARQTKQFNSQELEDGSSAKGLSGGVGNGTGNWRLELDTELNIKPLAYVRTTHDGFLTSIHEVAAETEDGSMRYDVPFFNPGRNDNQQSRLRLINPGDGNASISISARDDSGNVSSGNVSLALAARAAVTLTAKELEEGGEDFMGSLGTGSGKWQLTVSANSPVEVLSLMFTRTGHLTNLSR